MSGWGAARPARAASTSFALTALLAATDGRATEPEDTGSDNTEHTVIVGVGGAGEVELADGSFHPGAAVMFEWEAVEDWLLLVKKPFRLTRWSEFMIGLGPEVVVVSNATRKATYLGGEVALDFMFWPWTRRLGFWIEPDYDFVVRDGLRKSAAITDTCKQKQQSYQGPVQKRPNSPSY